MYVIKRKGKGVQMIHRVEKSKISGGSIDDFYEWVRKQHGTGITHHGVEIPYFFEYYEKHTPYPRWEIPPNSNDKYASDYVSRILKLMMDYSKDVEGTNQLSTELKNEFVKIKHKAEMFKKEMEGKSEHQELKTKISSIEKETKAINEDSMNNRYRAWKFGKAFYSKVYNHILSLIVGESKQTIDKISDFVGGLFSAAGQGEVKAGLDSVSSIGEKILNFVDLPSGKLEDLSAAIKKSLDEIRASTWDNLSPSQQESEIKKGFNPNKSLNKQGTGLSGWGTKENKDVQSILFSKAKWTASEAKKWLEKNGYLSSKMDQSKNKLRFRQKEPEGGRYATKKLSDGIELVFEYPNEAPIKGSGLLPPWPSDSEMKRMDISEIKKIVPNTITANPVPLSKSEIEQIAARLNKLPINQQLAAASQWQPGVLNYLRTMKNEYNSHLRSGSGLYGGSAGDVEKKRMMSRLYKIIDELNAKRGKLIRENANINDIHDVEEEIREAQTYVDLYYGSGLYGGMVKPILVLLSIDTMDLNEVKEILPAWINANSIERKHTKRILDGIDLDNPEVELHEGVLNYLREIKADYRQRAATQRRANRPPRFEQLM